MVVICGWINAELVCVTFQPHTYHCDEKWKIIRAAVEIGCSAVPPESILIICHWIVWTKSSECHYVLYGIHTYHFRIVLNLKLLIFFSHDCGGEWLLCGDSMLCNTHQYQRISLFHIFSGGSWGSAAQATCGIRYVLETDIVCSLLLD